MGYSLCFLGVHGKVSHLILEELNLRRTGEREEIPESQLTGVELPSGCYVIILHEGTELLHDAVLSQMSLECDCVGCFVDEQAMFSSAVGWKNGRKVWLASHDAKKGRDHLQLRGEFPSLFGPILERGKALQKPDGPDHYFKIPVELARELTGFSYDEDIKGLGKDAYEVLARSTSQQKPKAARPFGG
jgi:hypothetical protein